MAEEEGVQHSGSEVGGNNEEGFVLGGIGKGEIDGVRDSQTFPKS